MGEWGALSFRTLAVTALNFFYLFPFIKMLQNSISLDYPGIRFGNALWKRDNRQRSQSFAVVVDDVSVNVISVGMSLPAFSIGYDAMMY